MSTPESVRSSSALLKADGRAAVVFEPQKDGRLRVTYHNWEDAKVVEPGSRLEFVWEEGQVRAYRRTGGPIDYRALLKRYMRDVVSLGRGDNYLLNDGCTLAGPDLLELQAIEAEVRGE